MYKYCTYKFYLPDGRRIAAFAELTKNKRKLQIRLVYCSTQDQFSKKKAKYIYGRLFQGLESNGEDIGCPTCLYHPDTVGIDINPEKPHQSFMDYMRENYFQLGYEWVDRPVLIRESDLEVRNIKGAKLISQNEIKVTLNGRG